MSSVRGRGSRLGSIAFLCCAVACDDARPPPPSGAASEPVHSRCAVPPGADPRVRGAFATGGRRCTRVAVSLGAPRDVIESSDGSIYVSEMALGRVSRVDGTQLTTLADGLGAPIGLREMDDGSLLVGEEASHRVSRIDRSTGARTTLFEDLGNVTYVAVGPDRAAYASSFRDLGSRTGVVYRLDPGAGSAGRTEYATGLAVPEGIAFDDAERLIVAEWGAPSRASRLVAGGGPVDGGTVVAEGFVHLYGTITAANGDGVLVADVAGDRVAHVHADGSVEDILVDVAAPAGIWLAKNGDLLVTEHVDADAHGATGYLIRVSPP